MVCGVVLVEVWGGRVCDGVVVEVVWGGGGPTVFLAR